MKIEIKPLKRLSLEQFCEENDYTLQLEEVVSRREGVPVPCWCARLWKANVAEHSSGINTDASLKITAVQYLMQSIIQEGIYIDSIGPKFVDAVTKGFTLSSNAPTKN